MILLIMAKQRWALADGVVFANHNWRRQVVTISGKEDDSN